MKTSICTNGFSIFISIVILIVLYFVVPVEGPQYKRANAGNSLKVTDHSYAVITYIPGSVINQKKTNLQIAYKYTTNENRLTNGIAGLLSLKSGRNIPYTFNNYGSGELLDLHDKPFTNFADYDGNYSLYEWDYDFNNSNWSIKTSTPAERINVDSSWAAGRQNNKPAEWAATAPFMPTL